MTKELNFFQKEIEILTKKQVTVADDATSLFDAPSLPSLSQQGPEQQQEEQADSLELKEALPQVDHQVERHIKKVIEALLFTSQDPLPLIKIREITDTICPVRPRHLRQLIEALRQEYIAQQRAFKLEEIAQGYVLRTHEEYAPYLDILHRQRRGEKLSHAATEALAIIAYRQPITRPQIDAIRGVDSSGTLMQLLERQLIEPVGKLEAPGRPTLYGTTKEFLKHFGLKDLSDLKK